MDPLVILFAVVLCVVAFIAGRFTSSNNSEDLYKQCQSEKGILNKQLVRAKKDLSDETNALAAMEQERNELKNANISLNDENKSIAGARESDGGESKKVIDKLRERNQSLETENASLKDQNSNHIELRKKLESDAKANSMPADVEKEMAKLSVFQERWEQTSPAWKKTINRKVKRAKAEA